MRKADVISYFHNNQSAVARELEITRASVNAWEEIIPYWCARKLAATHRKLPLDESLYDERLRPLPQGQVKTRHDAA